ncbi:MAG: hypothetical protein H6612_11365 [Ignavibacteriales bacterium]|nr:hypothetical protein [Ignavibacteriales bacterium]
MKTILIPVFENRISSRLDCTENFQIIKTEEKNITKSEIIKIVAKNPIEKLNAIKSLNPSTIICNGLTDFYKEELIKNNIEIIAWIHGNIDEIIYSFLNGKLKSKIEL